jgi:hypothetical protein
MSNFAEAKESLRAAQKLSPYDPNINNELKEINKLDTRLLASSGYQCLAFVFLRILARINWSVVQRNVAVLLCRNEQLEKQRSNSLYAKMGGGIASTFICNASVIAVNVHFHGTELNVETYLLQRLRIATKLVRLVSMQRYRKVFARTPISFSSQ